VSKSLVEQSVVDWCVIGWTVDYNARPSFAELEDIMNNFLKDEPTKYVFTVVSTVV